MAVRDNWVLRIRTSGRRTVLRVPTGEAVNEVKRSTGRAARKRELVKQGRCKDCGRPRTKYRHRCNQCQEYERKRWNRAYGNNFKTIKKCRRRTVLSARELKFVRRLMLDEVRRN